METSTEVQRKILTLTLNCSDRAYVENEESEYVDNLLKKFPLLKQIVLMVPVLSTEWPEFVAVHNETCSENKQSHIVAQVGEDSSKSLIPQYTFRHHNTEENESNIQKTLYYAQNNPEYQDKLNKDGICFVKETGMEVSCCDGEEGKKIYWVDERTETPEEYHQVEAIRYSKHLYFSPHTRKGGARI